MADYLYVHAGGGLGYKTLIELYEEEIERKHSHRRPVEVDEKICTRYVRRRKKSRLMIFETVATRTITWDDDDTPLVDGEPLYLNDGGV